MLQQAGRKWRPTVDSDGLLTEGRPEDLVMPVRLIKLDWQSSFGMSYPFVRLAAKITKAIYIP